VRGNPTLTCARLPRHHSLTEESGLVFGSEPKLAFFEAFLRAALLRRRALPAISDAVAARAAQMGGVEEEAIRFLAAQFRAEALWLACGEGWRSDL